MKHGGKGEEDYYYYLHKIYRQVEFESFIDLYVDTKTLATTGIINHKMYYYRLVTN